MISSIAVLDKDLKRVCLVLSELMHFLHLFFALLEATKVILNEKRRVELAHGDVIVSWTRSQ